MLPRHHILPYYITYLNFRARSENDGRQRGFAEHDVNTKLQRKEKTRG